MADDKNIIGSMNIMNTLAAISENAHKATDTTEIKSNSIRKIEKKLSKKR